MLNLPCLLDSNDLDLFLQTNSDFALAQGSAPEPHIGHRNSEDLPVSLSNWCELVAGDSGGGRDLERAAELGGE